MNKTLLPFAMSLTLMLAAGTASAQGFSLEGAVIDSRTGNSLGVITERGSLNDLFKAQKSVTFGILRSAGISLEQLSPEVRARIERFQTTNIEAFRAFSQGLDLKDQGKFSEARELFRRAAQLDPGFALANQERVSMPDVNVSSPGALRAAVAAAAGTAVAQGKALFAVDVAGAQAALQAGQNVVQVSSDQLRGNSGGNYNVNETLGGGSGQGDGSKVSASLSYSETLAPGVVNNTFLVVGELGTQEVSLSAGVLNSLGERTSGYQAARGNATAANTGNTTLADGTVAYWGSWLSAAGNSSALLTRPGQGTVQAPTLGQIDWVVASATRSMPTVSSVTFTPAGGLLQNVTGSIQVNFAQRDVVLQNLGFDAGGRTFSNLNGSAQYAGTGAGAFGGFYSSGTCASCPGFVPGSSFFGGSFAGQQANGLIFSTLLVTGSPINTVGAHVFKRP